MSRRTPSSAASRSTKSRLLSAHRPGGEGSPADEQAGALGQLVAIKHYADFLG